MGLLESVGSHHGGFLAYHRFGYLGVGDGDAEVVELTVHQRFHDESLKCLGVGAFGIGVLFAQLVGTVLIFFVVDFVTFHFGHCGVVLYKSHGVVHDSDDEQEKCNENDAHEEHRSAADFFECCH